MADTGKVHLWDASQHIQSLDRPPTQRIPPAKPTFTFDGHRGEGFAVDWSTQVAGRLATGDTYRNIHVWDPHSGSWQVSGVYAGHTASVEDLQWSPTETTVFASCSSDRTIRIFDTRERSRAMLTVEAHAADVNVISWNRKTAHLLLSGSDDGSLKVWDLRAFNAAAPAAHYRWHAAAITSVEWHPVDDSVFAASSADDSVSFWDMGLEEDNDLPVEGADLAGTYVPSQLLFIHRGQSHIKEVHWHPQIPGMCVSTAFDGINYLMPDNLRSLEETDFEGKFLPGYQPPTEGMSGEAGDEKSGGKQQSKKSSRKRSKKASLKNEGTKSADVDMA
jgi:ribosome assembly protein RRB1